MGKIIPWVFFGNARRPSRRTTGGSQLSPVTIPGGVIGSTTRVVRDGANVGEAYSLDVTLQRNN
jgi:hypothetical protein